MVLLNFLFLRVRSHLNKPKPSVPSTVRSAQKVRRAAIIPSPERPLVGDERTTGLALLGHPFPPSLSGPLTTTTHLAGLAVEGGGWRVGRGQKSLGILQRVGEYSLLPSAPTTDISCMPGTVLCPLGHLPAPHHLPAGEDT